MGGHTYDLPQIRADIASRAVIVAAFDIGLHDVTDWRRRNAATFFATHPNCRIGIRDEYGDTHSPVPWEHPGHRPVQHRDGQPPWCDECGWSSPIPAKPAMQIKEIGAIPLPQPDVDR